MKAFISYSHADAAVLDKLHTHLAHLKREALLNSWTDREITAGGLLNQQIEANLLEANLFLALLSPEYIASNYCYEIEFKKAIELNKQNHLIIIPIIVEPCDWLSTPFKEFKALPKDGKPISDWQNVNTAFLNVVQELRKLIEGNESGINTIESSSTSSVSTRNYKVKKDFDSIQKLEFKEKSFKEIKKLLIDFLSEVELLDGIKNRILKDTDTEFETLLVNRNKVNTEARLKVNISNDEQNISMFFGRTDLTYSFDDEPNRYNLFEVSNDDFEIFWLNNSTNHFHSQIVMRVDSKEIANIIWDELLTKVGIV